MSSGFMLSVVTASMWGILPVFLKGVLQRLDPVTITWIRLLFATILVGGYYSWTGKWPPAKQFSVRNAGLFAAVGLAMAANYWLFLAGLDLVPPPVAQLTIQSGPLFLALGGWYFFAEKIRKRQLAGFLMMLAGFMLFYSGKIWFSSAPGSPPSDTYGVMLVVLAAIAWAVYALIQKMLSSQFPSSFILLAGYSGAGVLLGPVASPGEISGLDSTLGWYLLFCCINTVVAYGCFAEAVQRWEASRVSAVLAITPIITFVCSLIEARLTLGYVPSELTASPMQWLGAVLVVSGSMGAALNSRRVQAHTPARLE